MVFLTRILHKIMPSWLPRIETHTSDKSFKSRHNLLKMTGMQRGRMRNCTKLARCGWERNIRISQTTIKAKREERWLRDMYAQRISAACDEHRYSYKYFWGVLPTMGIELDRKILAHLAIWEPRTFASLIKICQAKVAEGTEKGEEASLIEPPDGVISRKML